jgi:hypothetical protein
MKTLFRRGLWLALIVLVASLGGTPAVIAQCTDQNPSCDPVYDEIVLWNACNELPAGCCWARHYAYRCSPGGTQLYYTDKVMLTGDLCVAQVDNETGQILSYACF